MPKLRSLDVSHNKELYKLPEASQSRQQLPSLEVLQMESTALHVFPQVICFFFVLVVGIVLCY